MEPQMIPSEQPKPEQPTRGHKKPLLISGIVVILLIAAGVSWYLLKAQSNNSANQPEKGLHNQTFSQTSPFNLASSRSGSGVSFVAPDQYKLAYEPDTHDQASLADASHNGQQSFFAGAIHVASVPQPGAKNLRQNYENIFSKTGTNSYQSTLIVIHQFLSQRFSPLYNIAYEAPASFTSSSISSDAWQINFTATPKQTQPMNSQLEKYSGRIVFAVGHETLYYFAAYSTYYNWDNNLSTWSKVFSSLKIDQ